MKRINVFTGIAILTGLIFLLISCSDNNPVNSEEQQEILSITDIDGNIYDVIKIGDQYWTANNLMTTRFNNGDEINHAVNKSGWSDNDDSRWRSSLGRLLADLDTEAEKEIELFKTRLKIVAFSDLINQFKQVRDWNFGTVFAYIIAQHYGIRTQYLDITDDLAVALFFACCKHVGDGKYKPVNEKDIEGYYGEYAVLYRKAGGILMNLESAVEINKVLSIGYQPFTHCYKQSCS